jgi:hypothetical protein
MLLVRDKYSQLIFPVKPVVIKKKLDDSELRHTQAGEKMNQH